MNQQIKIAREVALRADGFYGTAEALGQKAADALGEKKRAQITGLESQANSALKVSDVLDFIKVRTARHEEWRNQGFGIELLQYIETNLRQQRQSICATLAIAEETIVAQEVYLLLIRALIRQVAAHYEFACQLRGTSSHARDA